MGKKERVYTAGHYKKILNEAFSELGQSIKHNTKRIKEKHSADTTTITAHIPTTMHLEIHMLKKKYGLRNIDFLFHGIDAIKKHITRLKGRKGVDFLAKMEKEVDRLNEEAGSLILPAIHKRRHKY